MPKFLLISALLLGFSCHSLHTHSTSDVQQRVLTEPDEDGDIEISVKVTVVNRSNKDRLIKIWVQGLDAEGFEIFDIPLSGTFKPGESRDLTDTWHINTDLNKQITYWQVEY